MKILAIESSCDETAVAVVDHGQRVLANVVASQIDLHAKTGGVVPEVASRAHMEAMMPVLRDALAQADCGWAEIDAVAVTCTPGLVGSLIVGRMTAAALAFAHDKPLIEVNHIHGHLYSSWLDLEETPEFPILILTVSGGHNELVLMRGHGDYEVLGESLDDAAGEAFDKTARLLGLGYPGGPAVERAAQAATGEVVPFPQAKVEGYDFSFSGLKTSVLYYLQKHAEQLEGPGREAFVSRVAAGFQDAVVGALVDKVLQAVEALEPKEVHLVGGVSANQFLRARIQEALDGQPQPPLFRRPQQMRYCTDNAAMIAAAAYFLHGEER